MQIGPSSSSAASCMFINCRTSPSAITLVASASTCHDAHVLGLDHHLESARVQEVADQYAGRIAEGLVGGGMAATQRRIIDHIVMQQGGSVDEFDHRGQVERCAPV
jgi:hypothetical protein